MQDGEVIFTIAAFESKVRRGKLDDEDGHGVFAKLCEGTARVMITNRLVLRLGVKPSDLDCYPGETMRPTLFEWPRGITHVVWRKK